MGQRQNLAAALTAVKHVQKIMTVGAQNKPLDVIFSLGMSLLCVDAIRRVEISVPNQAGDDALGMARQIRESAAKAISAGCGNCGEQAAIAFEYLKAANYRPLEYVIFYPGDHAFVVLGRTKESSIDDFKSWGPDAVVCDPWDEKAFSAHEIPLKMHKKQQQGFLVYHRLD